MYYPIMIDLKDKNVCIIGGGNIALRKAKKYLDYEASVFVVGKVIKSEFYKLKDDYCNNLTLSKGEFKEEHLKNAFLVEIATDNRELNNKIYDICKYNNILCNVVDSPKDCDYIIPATVKRGSLILSVSTCGKSPSYSSKIRKELEAKYDEANAEFVDLLGDARNLVLLKFTDADSKKALLNKMAYMTKSELIEAIEKLEEM